MRSDVLSSYVCSFDLASAVRDKLGQAIDARIIIDIGVAIAENVHELNVFVHLDLGAVSHTVAQHSFERIDIGIYHAWAARTLQLQLFQRTRKRARRRQCIGTGQHVCKNRTAASRMITIIINDRGVLQAFKWFKQQRHTECARIERSEEHTSELQSLMRISY